MVGFCPFAPRIHIRNQLPKFSVKFQVTRREQFHIADQLIPPIILDAIQAGAQGFQAHIDVFGHQNHFSRWIAILNLKRAVNDPVVIGLNVIKPTF